MRSNKRDDNPAQISARPFGWGRLYHITVQQGPMRFFIWDIQKWHKGCSRSRFSWKNNFLFVALQELKNPDVDKGRSEKRSPAAKLKHMNDQRMARRRGWRSVILSSGFLLKESLRDQLMLFQ